MTTIPRRLTALLLVLGAPLVVIVVRVFLGDALPDPLPTHWDLRGEVDGTMSVAALSWTMLAVSAALALVATGLLVRPRPGYADRGILVGLTWTAWLATAVFVVSALAARGAGAAADVDLPWWGPFVLPVVPTLAAAATARAVPAVLTDSRSPAPGSSLDLAPTERATWLGGSSSWVLGVLSAGLLLVAAVTAFAAWPVALVLAVIALVIFWARMVTVRVDDRAVTVAWGPVRWPRLVLPLDGLDGARTEHVEPLRWGGWGYRVSRRGTAVVARRGPGLVLDRRGRLPMAVTLDAPEGAADLVNALVARGSTSDSTRRDAAD